MLSKISKVKVAVYVLECEDGKWYVGQTGNSDEAVIRRYKQHTTGVGSEFTKRYKPVRLAEALQDESPYTEGRLVLEYMEKFGIDNVRGGIYSNLNLTKQQKDTINMEIRNACKKCFKCGLEIHKGKCEDVIGVSRIEPVVSALFPEIKRPQKFDDSSSSSSAIAGKGGKEGAKAVKENPPFLEMFDKLKTIKALAEYYGTNEEDIRERIAKLKTRRGTPWIDTDEYMLKQCLKEGMTKAEIARKLMRTEYAIELHLNN